MKRSSVGQHFLNHITSARKPGMKDLEELMGSRGSRETQVEQEEELSGSLLLVLFSFLTRQPFNLKAFGVVSIIMINMEQVVEAEGQSKLLHLT